VGPAVPGFGQVHGPGCASLKEVDIYRGHAADMKNNRLNIDAYEVMRDVDFEKRLKALERAQAEAAAEAAKAKEGK
jgi:hypothetical protein